MYKDISGAVYDEKQKAEIQRQLDRLLENSHFSHSKRFPSFLRFIIQEELEGRGDQLKERTLGIEVFGRNAGYDTTSDPIVRVTAAEIRKRIAQYYQDSNNPAELRISLPPGSYVPQFDWPQTEPGTLTGHSSLAGRRTTYEGLYAPPALPIGATTIEHKSSRTRMRWIISAATLCLLAIALWAWVASRPSTLDRFWAPVFRSGDPISLCFPQSSFSGQILRDAATPTEEKHLDEPIKGVVLDDLQPLMSLAGLLETRGRSYALLDADTTPLADLRHGPTIFVGAFDNAWTLRIMRGLRYRFGNDPNMMHFWIEDSRSPANNRWSIDRGVQQTTQNYRDYAIVARFRDENTGEPAVIAAGIARGGTVAAGEFLTQPGYIDAIKSHAPKNWDGQNMEIVLSTEIINGSSSPPKVVATFFW